MDNDEKMTATQTAEDKLAAELKAAQTHTAAPVNQKQAVPEIPKSVLRVDDSDKTAQARADAIMEAKLSATAQSLQPDIKSSDTTIGRSASVVPDITSADNPDNSDDTYQPSDIFEWANNIVQYKDELQFDLFLISKTNFLYRAKFNKDLARMMEPLFIDGIIDYVLDGAGTGMIIREFEESATEDNVLQRTRVKKIEKLVELFGWLKTQEHEIETFADEEHDIKRIKGVMARISHPKLSEPFYVMKVLPQAMVMKGSISWMIRDGRFIPFDAEAALRIPPDNQMMVLRSDIFVFNESKLDTLFGYNAKKRNIAEKKAQEISQNYKLVFAEGLTIDNLVHGKKTIINKLQKLEVGHIKQEKLIEHADDLEIEMLTNDDGAIIIMDVNDLTTFVNLLSDDYMESALTGERYEIKSKKLLRPKEDPAAAPPLK